MAIANLYKVDEFMANTTTAWRYIPSRSFLVHFKPSFLSTYWLKDKKWKLKDIRYKLKIKNNATKMKRTVRKRSTQMPFHHCHKPVFSPKMAIFQRAVMREGGWPLPIRWFKFGHDIFAGFKLARLLTQSSSISFYRTAEKQSFQL